MSGDRLVLCIEDEPDIGWLIQRTLDSLPIEIVVKNNGSDGLALIAERRPDLIVLDLMLPRMSGWDFLEQVRTNEDWQDIPVIILSVRSEREDKDRGKEFGVAYYMTKPFIPRELQRVVRDILDPDETKS